MVSPELLQRYTFFNSLTDEQLNAIATVGSEKSFPKDSILFKEHTAADRLMLLLEGGVELFYAGGGEGAGADSTVCPIVPGAIFGVSSLIKPYQYTASARTAVPVRVVDFDGAALRRMAENDPMLDHVLMNNVAAAVLARLH